MSVPLVDNLVRVLSETAPEPVACGPGKESSSSEPPEGNVDTRGDQRGSSLTSLSPMVIPSGVPSGDSFVPYGDRLHGEALTALDADDGFVNFVLARAGLDRDVWGPQAWSLEDDTLEATTVRTRDGRWQVRLAGHETPAPLAVVYAAAISGTFGWLGKAELPRWKRRALLEGGFIAAPAVELAPLAEDAPDSLTTLWAALGLLVRVRVLGGEEATDPLPLSRPFLRRWAAMTESRVRSGMEGLERAGLIWRVDEHVKPGGRRALVLWRTLLVDEVLPG